MNYLSDIILYAASLFFSLLNLSIPFNYFTFLSWIF